VDHQQGKVEHRVEYRQVKVEHKQVKLIYREDLKEDRAEAINQRLKQMFRKIHQFLLRVRAGNNQLKEVKTLNIKRDSLM
jgi:hypothetical protein